MERFRFKEFRVYQEAKDYCRFCKEVSKSHIERFDKSLNDQIERALSSTVLNIAEGSADQSDAEFARFLGISLRSVYETVAAFDLAALYGYIGDESNNDIEDQAHSLVKQLASFRNKLKRKVIPLGIPQGISQLARGC
jgi:four helix bundle protein